MLSQGPGKGIRRSGGLCCCNPSPFLFSVSMGMKSDFYCWHCNRNPTLQSRCLHLCLLHLVWAKVKQGMISNRNLGGILLSYFCMESINITSKGPKNSESAVLFLNTLIELHFKNKYQTSIFIWSFISLRLQNFIVLLLQLSFLWQAITSKCVVSSIHKIINRQGKLLPEGKSLAKA